MAAFDDTLAHPSAACCCPLCWQSCLIFHPQRLIAGFHPWANLPATEWTPSDGSTGSFVYSQSWASSSAGQTSSPQQQHPQGKADSSSSSAEANVSSVNKSEGENSSPSGVSHRHHHPQLFDWCFASSMEGRESFRAAKPVSRVNLESISVQAEKIKEVSVDLAVHHFNVGKLLQTVGQSCLVWLHAISIFS